MANPKKVGLVGFFEDYTHLNKGPQVDLHPGINYTLTKANIRQHVFDTAPSKVCIVDDPVYTLPLATVAGIERLDTNLCWLYANMAMQLNLLSRGYDLFVMHSEIDIYAEIMINFGRQKWLEPLLKKQIASYDLLIHVPFIYQTHLKPNVVGDVKKYDNVVRKIMNDYKGEYVRTDNTLEAVWRIAENYSTDPEVHRLKTQPDQVHPTVPTGVDPDLL